MSFQQTQNPSSSDLPQQGNSAPTPTMTYIYERQQGIVVTPRVGRGIVPNAILNRAAGPRSPRPRHAQPPPPGLGGVVSPPASLAPSVGGLPVPSAATPRIPFTGFINTDAGPSLPASSRLPRRHPLDGFDFTPTPVAFANAILSSSPLPQPDIPQDNQGSLDPTFPSSPLVDSPSLPLSPPYVPSDHGSASSQLESSEKKKTKGKEREIRRQFSPEVDEDRQPEENDEEFYRDIENGVYDDELAPVGGGGGDESLGDFMGDSIRTHPPLPNFLDRRTPPTPSPLPTATKKRQRIEAVVIPTRSKKTRGSAIPPTTSTPVSSRVLRSHSRTGPTTPVHRHGRASPPRGSPKKPLPEELLRSLRRAGEKPYWRLEPRHGCFDCRRRGIDCLVPKGWKPGDKCLSCKTRSCSFCPRGSRETLVVDQARQLHKGFKRSLAEYPEELQNFAGTFYNHLRRLVEAFAPLDSIGFRTEYKMVSIDDPSDVQRLVPSIANRAPSSVADSDLQEFNTDAGESVSIEGVDEVETEDGERQEGGEEVVVDETPLVNTTDNVDNTSSSVHRPVNSLSSLDSIFNSPPPQAGPEDVDIFMEGEEEVDELDED